MPQSINKFRIYFYIFSFFCLSTITNNNLDKIIKNYFLITDVKIETNLDEIKYKLTPQISFLFNKNIFLIQKNELLLKLQNLNFLENIEIKKKYPSTINIKAKKTKIIAITYIEQKKYYVGQNGQFINAKKISNNDNLPIIFGKFKISDFYFLINKLSNQKINNKKIIKYFYHKNKRWDLYFDNNILIKLPSKNIDNALNIYKQFMTENIINPNTTIDLRIQNRIVLKYE